MRFSIKFCVFLEVFSKFGPYFDRTSSRFPADRKTLSSHHLIMARATTAMDMGFAYLDTYDPRQPDASRIIWIDRDNPQTWFAEDEPYAGFAQMHSAAFDASNRLTIETWLDDPTRATNDMLFIAVGDPLVRKAVRLHPHLSMVQCHL